VPGPQMLIPKCSSTS